MFESLCFPVPVPEKVCQKPTKPEKPPFISDQPNYDRNGYQSQTASIYSSYPETDVTDSKKTIDTVSETSSKRTTETGV